MFKIYNKTLNLHVSGNRAYEYIQTLTTAELEAELKEFHSWDGAVLQGAIDPVDCSEEIGALQDELDYRKATNE